MKVRASALLLAALVLSTPLCARQAWGQFRGPGGQGVAEGTGYPVAFGPAENLRWKTAVPPGHSSPCVVGDRLFLTAASEEGFSVLGFDRRSGEELWVVDLPCAAMEKHHDVNSPASSSPATDGERLFAYFGSRGLFAFDLDGGELWARDIEPAPNTFGTAASPIVVDGRLVLVRDAKEHSFLEALDPASGKTLWRTDRRGFGSGWSTPTVRRRGDTTELLVYGVGFLTAYDLADGEPLWSVPGLTDEPIITPALGDDLVFVTSYNMKTNTEVRGLPTFAELVEAYDADGNGLLNRSEADQNESILSRHDADGEGDHPLRIFFRWLDADKNGELDAAEYETVLGWVDSFAHANGLIALRPGTADDEPKIAWQFPRGVPECPSPLYADGRVYLVKNGGIASAFRATDGELLWQERLGARGPFYASPVLADGRIYAASARGEIAVFSAGDTFELLAKNDLGERLMATPAPVDGTLYVRTEGHLWAFAAR